MCSFVSGCMQNRVVVRLPVRRVSLKQQTRASQTEPKKSTKQILYSRNTILRSILASGALLSLANRVDASDSAPSTLSAFEDTLATSKAESAAVPTYQEGSPIKGIVSTVHNITAAAVIGLILIQNPQSTDASEALAKGLGSMKQSTSFLTITTWVLIATFVGTSAVLAL
mmetsp:Transcript_28903/g.39923  ORF Transcript_28903/g.39923 Transcript_28903/m.39923 type:complete len:170 (-) Transcript_28903:277-786(-)